MIFFLGENTSVTTYNVMLYLGIVEKRCEDLQGVVGGWRAIKREEKAAMEILKKPTSAK